MAYISKVAVCRGVIVEEDEYEGLTKEKALRILKTEAKIAKKHRDRKGRKSIVVLTNMAMTEIRPNGVVVTFQLSYPGSMEA